MCTCVFICVEMSNFEKDKVDTGVTLPATRPLLHVQADYLISKACFSSIHWGENQRESWTDYYVHKYLLLSAYHTNFVGSQV